MKRFRQSSDWGGRAAGALLVLSLGLGPGFSASAQDTELQVPTTPGAPESAIDLRMSEGKILLTLQEATTIALRQNLGLVVERFTREQFRLGIGREMGIFDLGITAGGSFGESSERTSNAFSGVAVLTSETQAFDIGLSQLDPLGGTTSFTFGGSRNASNSPFDTLNPRLDASTGIGYRLPLLRGFGRETTEQGILVARLASAGNLQTFEIQVADTIRQVENGYWDLVEALDQLRVAEESLSLAEELHRRNQVQVDVGTLPPLELVRSEANMATRHEDIIRARTNVGNANDRLRQLLNIEPGAAWEAEIIPETEPRTPPIDIDVAAALSTALAERPEIARQRLELERLELIARIATKAVLPRLDLSVRYGLAGRAGDVRDVSREEPVPDPPVIDSSNFGDALQQITDRDLDGWSVGLEFAYPLQNRFARAQRTIANLEVEKGEALLTTIEQQIRTEVRTAARAVSAAAQQIESAGVSRRLQEKNLEAEQKRYENGMSTSFEVTQVQEDLNAAKSREVTAIASYRRALAEYYRSIGRLLEETGVELVEPGT